MMLEIFNYTVTGPWNRGDVKTDTEYKIETVDGIMKIAFQGSTSRRDWIENFRFWVKMYKRMMEPFYVHKGFFIKYHSIRDVLIREIFLQKPWKIQVSGFSQGAAMAALAYEDIRYHYPLKILTGYGFGSPRVLWNPRPEIRRRWIESYYNVINGNDLVTKLPPRIMGYKHVGMHYQYGAPRQICALDWRVHCIAGYREALAVPRAPV